MKIKPLPDFKVFESDHADETYAALNRLFDGQKTFINRLASTPNRTSLSSGNISRSVVFHFRSAHDLLVNKKDAEDYITINLPITGHLQVVIGSKAEVTSSGHFGSVLPMAENTKAVVTGWNGLGLVLPRPAIHEALESLTGKAALVPVDFDLVLDTQSAGGRVIRDSIEMAARQFQQAQSPLGHPAVAARLEEFIINSLLHGQPHNHRDAMAGERQAASPKQVRRAEVYIQAHASEAIRLAQIAEAAGCSIRALQLAFRTFRDTTPMAMLRQVRLARAHAELLQSDPGTTTVTDVAVKFGFFNGHRFVQDYKKSFGQLPSETLRFGSANRQLLRSE